MPKKTALLLKKLKNSWQKAFSNLIPLGGFSYHNHINIFHSGDEAFSAIFAAISQAQSFIYIETYTLSPDELGVKLRTELLKARERDILVTILYDHFGSQGLTNSYLAPLIKAGVKVVAFNPIWPWRKRGPLLFRDHRKIIIIDDMAFCGSMNISTDYAGPIYGNSRFRDTTAQVLGPVVKDLLKITEESIFESQFDQSAEQITQVVKLKIIDKSQAVKRFFKSLFAKKPVLRLEDGKKGVLIQVVRSNTRRNLYHIQKSIEESVNRAVSYCYFTTPYFLPHDGLRKALIDARERGVDVQILTAGLSDVPLMRYASRHIYKSFLEKGIRIYEMEKQTLHAKLATIDGIYSLLGSYNLDHWSARRNLEVNLAVIDQETALKLKEQFALDLAIAEEIEKNQFFARSKFRRFLCWLAYLLMRI